MKQVTALLKKRGIPQAAINDIRMAFIQDAVQNAGDVHADRMFTLVAMMLMETYGFGHTRIFRGLQKLDELAARAAQDGEWPVMMEELREKTGIVVSSDSGDRIAFEYRHD